MARGQSPYQGNYTVPMVDFSPLERGGAAWGRAFEQIGGALGKGIEQKAQLQDEKKIALSSLKFAENLLPSVMTRLPQSAQKIMKDLLKSAREAADDPNLNLRQQVAGLQGFTKPMMPWVHAISSMPKQEAADIIDKWAATLGQTTTPQAQTKTPQAQFRPFYGGQVGGEGTLPDDLAAKLAAMQQAQVSPNTLPTVNPSALPPIPDPSNLLPPMGPEIPEPSLPSDFGDTNIHGMPPPAEPPLPSFDVLPKLPGGPLPEIPSSPSEVSPEITYPYGTRVINEDAIAKFRESDEAAEAGQAFGDIVAMVEDGTYSKEQALQQYAAIKESLRGVAPEGTWPSVDAIMNREILDALPLNKLFDTDPRPEPAPTQSGPEGPEGTKGPNVESANTISLIELSKGAGQFKRIQSDLLQGGGGALGFVPNSPPKEDDLSELLGDARVKEAAASGIKPGAPFIHPDYKNLIYRDFDSKKGRWSVGPAPGYTWDKPKGQWAVKPKPKKQKHDFFGTKVLVNLEDLGEEDSHALLNLYEIGVTAKTEEEQVQAQSNFTRLAEDLIADPSLKIDSVEQVVELVGKEYEKNEDDKAVKGLRDKGIEIKMPPKPYVSPQAPRDTGIAPDDPDEKRIWNRKRVIEELKLAELEGTNPDGTLKPPEPFSAQELLYIKARNALGARVEDASTKDTYDRIDAKIKAQKEFPQERLKYQAAIMAFAEQAHNLDKIQQPEKTPTEVSNNFKEMQEAAAANNLTVKGRWDQESQSMVWNFEGIKADLRSALFDVFNPVTKKVERKHLIVDGMTVMKNDDTNEFMLINMAEGKIEGFGGMPTYAINHAVTNMRSSWEIQAANTHIKSINIDSGEAVFDVDMLTFTKMMEKADGWWAVPQIQIQAQKNKEGLDADKVTERGWDAGQGRWVVEWWPPDQAEPKNIVMQVYEWDEDANTVVMEDGKPKMTKSFAKALEVSQMMARQKQFISVTAPQLLMKRAGQSLPAVNQDIGSGPGRQDPQELGRQMELRNAAMEK